MHEHNLAPDVVTTVQSAKSARRPGETELVDIARQVAEMARAVAELKIQNGDLVKLLGVLTKTPALTPSSDIVLRDASLMMPPHRRSPVTMRRYAKRGSIPAEKVGHQWVVDAPALQKQLDHEKQARAAVAEFLGKPVEPAAAPVAVQHQAAVGAFLAKRSYTRRKPAPQAGGDHHDASAAK